MKSGQDLSDLRRAKSLSVNGNRPRPVSKSKHSQLHVEQASFSSHARPKMNNIFLQALSFYKVFQSFDSSRAKGKFVLVDPR